MKRFLCVATALGLLAALAAPPAGADAKSKAVQEAAEYVLKKFGKEAAGTGAEVLARRIGTLAARHGDEAVTAVRKVGPRAFQLVEKAGPHSDQALKAMARHGEAGAVWVASRPRALSLAAKHGDEAAAALVKHAGIAEGLVDKAGAPAVRAFQSVGPQGGRRLAMLAESGELAKAGRAEQLLEVIGKYGDPAADFVWRHKGALAVTAVAAAFVADPEPFLNGTKDLAQVVGENAVRPLAEAPAALVTEVAWGTNWSLVFLAGLVLAGLLLGGKLWLRHYHVPPREPPTARGG